MCCKKSSSSSGIGCYLQRIRSISRDAGLRIKLTFLGALGE